MARPTARDSHVDAAMTNISIAYRNTEYIASQVFPIVTVEHKSDNFYVFDKDAWLRDRVQMRAPGTKAARVDYTLSTLSYATMPYALAKAVTDEERMNADEALRPDIDATEFVTDGLELGMEIRVADIVTACANWASASTPGTDWSNDASEPFDDIDNLQDAISGKIGRMPNIAVMSWPTWRILRNHPDFVDRVKHTRAGGRVEPDDLRNWFGFDKVLIGHAIKETGQEGGTSSISRVWGSVFWAGYVAPSPGLRTPSAGYCFEWGSRMAERFREDQEHQDIISVEHHTDEKITASDAGGGYYGIA